VAKDPLKLKVLVDEHNRRTSEANVVNRDQVGALVARHKKVPAECENLLEAIATSPKAKLATLTQAIEAREKELERLEGQIHDAQALVEPLLMPKLATVAGHLAGRASIFTGDLVADRAVLARFMERIVVDASGEIVLHFGRRIGSGR